MDEVFKVGNIRSRGMHIVWFLTNSSFPVVSLPVEHFLSLLCWTLECSHYWLCSVKCGWIRPLGRSFKSQPMFCHAPFLPARRPAMFLARGALLTCILEWRWCGAELQLSCDRHTVWMRNTFSYWKPWIFGGLLLSQHNLTDPNWYTHFDSIDINSLESLYLFALVDYV